jgi:small subunit ribosomal protein S20
VVCERPAGAFEAAGGPGTTEGTDDVANHESAIKAHRQSLVNRDRNRQYRSRLRTALKNVRAAIATGKSADVKASLGQTVSLIDKMAGKGIIHKNAAGRYKSRLMAKLGA